MKSLDDHLGGPWEDAFLDHLRLRAEDIHPETVAIGPWWRLGGQDQIDALALAGRARKPVLAGEAKWSREVNGARLAATLAAKASKVTSDLTDLRYAVCARESVAHAPPGMLVVTAEDMFSHR